MPTPATVSDLYPRQWLKPVDLYETMPRGVNVVIKAVNVEEFHIKPGSSETKPSAVLTFYRASRRMILNKTQCKALAELFGENFADWREKTINLTVGTQANKETIVISAAAPKPVAQPVAQPAPVPTEEEAFEQI